MDIFKLCRGLYKYTTDYQYRFIANNCFGLYNHMDDVTFLKKMYQIKTGRQLNLDNPQRFNEKLQWLKIHNRKDIFTTMVDKYEVKSLVADKIGSKYVIQTYGIWEKPSEIAYSELPNKFVLKTTHGCGGMVICKDKKNLSIKNSNRILSSTYKRNYFYNTREWPYYNVKPRILAEQLMEDSNHEVLPVYKVLNFNGEPKIIQTIQDDKTDHEKIDYFDIHWNHLDLRQNYENSNTPLYKPENLEEMLQLSRVCSEGIPFLRTDWYVVNGDIYFSEFTFFSDAGLEPFYPDEWDYTLGSWIDLSNVR